MTPGDSVLCTNCCVRSCCTTTTKSPTASSSYLKHVTSMVFRAATSYCVYNSSQDLNRTTPASSETTIQRRMRHTSCVSVYHATGTSYYKLILSHCLDIAVIHRLLCLCQPRLHDLPPDTFGRHSSRSTPSIRRYCEQTPAGCRRRGHRCLPPVTRPDPLPGTGCGW